MTPQYEEGLLRKYSNIGVVVDSNLLLLYIVGSIDLARIEKFKRTRIFAVEDFHILAHILRRFTTIVTTPNILTEVSNFLGQLPEALHPNYFVAFAKSITLLKENHIFSKELAQRPEFRWLHLTDSGIVNLASNNYLVITVDMKLANYLGRQGIDVINFNNIRPYS